MKSPIPHSITLLLVLPCLLAGLPAGADELERLTSKQAISALLAAYAYRWDSKDSQAFAELFAVDAVMQRGVAGEPKLASELIGRQAILEYAEDSHSNRLIDRQTRHHMSALVFLELTETTALTENMALITHQTESSGAPYISSSGIYTMRWRKTEQGWRIASRLLISDRFVAPQ